MVQGSYPRYTELVDEEKERLLKADEEAQIEITEVSLQDEDEQPEPPRSRCRWMRCRKNKDGSKKKRPVWRRILRLFLTIGLFWFMWISFAPFFAGMFSCNHRGMHHHGAPVVVKTGETPFEKPKLHYEFDEDLESFFIKQETDHHIPTRTNVFGSVHIHPAEGDKTEVDFHIKVSDESLWDSIKINPKKDGIVFSADAFSIVEQFINATLIVSIPEKNIKKLFVSTRELDITAKEGVKNDFDVSRFTSIAGDVHIHGTHKSKCVKLNSVSGNVKGAFDLLGGLAVKTVSGDIELKVTPVKSDHKKAFLGTDSVSGNVRCHVVHPLNDRELKSWHKSTSGDIHVRYPEEWQGKMKLTTTSGDFDVIGKHLKIDKKKKGFTGKFWRAIKGKGNSRAKIATISGDVKVSVGDE